MTIVAWALGATLTVHAASFFSVAYFGQMQAIFYWHLAMIGTLPVVWQTVTPRPEVPAGALTATR